MRHNAYTEEFVTTKVMLAGLKANVPALSRWGFDAEFIAALEGLHLEILSLGNEQQALKSRLKEKTAAIYAKMDAAQQLRKQARHMIKSVISQESWQEFGIEDTK